MAASRQMQWEMDLRATHARLTQLERGEWFRWGAVIVISLALTLGLLVLSLPAARPDSLGQDQLDLGIRGLLALVLLFDVFAIHQQVLITRLRRQLTQQLNLIVALDLLKGPARDEPAQAPSERRTIPRSHFEQILRVTSVGGTKVNIQGRIRDITEAGLGAVIPAPLEPGEEVTLEFTANDCHLALKAVVRYRRGIHYGFKFLGLTEASARTLREIRLLYPPLPSQDAQERREFGMPEPEHKTPQPLR